MITILPLRLNASDIEDFFNRCSQLKEKQISIEVGQDNKTICGSSVLGMATLNFQKPVMLISRTKLTESDKKLFEKWRW